MIASFMVKLYLGAIVIGSVVGLVKVIAGMMGG